MTGTDDQGDPLLVRVERLEQDLTPGVQRADPNSVTADLEAKIEGERVERVERAEDIADKGVVLAAKLAALKVIEDEASARERQALAVDIAEKRGEAAGRLQVVLERIDERLAGHDEHFRENNGDIRDIKGTLRDMRTAQVTRDEIAVKDHAEVIAAATTLSLSLGWKIALAGVIVALLAVVVTILTHYF
ncbi:MAG: hypothetical protein M3O28_11690 [Actinomycetota bacterium]|nr:hypothetical protein [Actinomycetota bacterium]